MMPRTTVHQVVRIVTVFALGAMVSFIPACSNRPPVVEAVPTREQAVDASGPSYLPTEVDKQATADPDNPVPYWVAPPEAARAQSSQMGRLPDARGTVVAAFVVDTMGAPVMSTFRVQQSDNDVFAATVKAAMRFSRFSPAEKDGRRVRELLTAQYVNSPPDKPAMPLPRNPFPRYPDNLQIAGVVGTVIAAFVVDTMGSVEASTVTILRSDNDGFTRSVEVTISHSHFAPTERNGRRVRTLVAVPYTFDMRGIPPNMNGGGTPGRPGQSGPPCSPLYRQNCDNAP